MLFTTPKGTYLYPRPTTWSRCRSLRPRTPINRRGLKNRTALASSDPNLTRAAAPPPLFLLSPTPYTPRGVGPGTLALRPPLYPRRPEIPTQTGRRRCQGRPSRDSTVGPFFRLLSRSPLSGVKCFLVPPPPPPPTHSQPTPSQLGNLKSVATLNKTYRPHLQRSVGLLVHQLDPLVPMIFNDS